MGAGEMEDEGAHLDYEEDDGKVSITGDVEELEGAEAFGVGVEAGRDMVRDELEKLLQDLEKPYAAEMPDEGGHHGQSCEEAHPGQPHEQPHMREY